MANILYRVTATPTVPTVTSVKSAALLNLEIDGNFKSIDNDLATKAPINSPTFTGTIRGLTKAMVGLGDADNTSDVDKPISNSTQLALNNKYQLNSFLVGRESIGAMAVANGGTSSGEIRNVPGVVNAAYMTFHRQGEFAVRIGLDIDNKFKIGGWSMGPVAYSFYHEGNKPAKEDVGLNDVDNTSDANKPVSIATKIAIDAVNKKVNTIIISTNTVAVTGGYYVAISNCTLTLPATPIIGDFVGFSNATGVTTCVINNNGRPILSLNESMTIDKLYLAFVLQYADASRGWVFL